MDQRQTCHCLGDYARSGSVAEEKPAVDSITRIFNYFRRLNRLRSVCDKAYEHHFKSYERLDDLTRFV